MFEDIINEELNWGGGTLKLEIGRMARQATASVFASFNDTSVLATVVIDKAANPEFDFVPLSVFYQEKAYAAGRIPGGFFKREGKPTESEVLISRLIDRPCRPLFDKNFRHETQVMVYLLSYDAETKADIISIIAASAALQLSGAPFKGPIGAARVGYMGGKFILNPQRTQMNESALDLIVAGTSEGVLMVESEAKELPEDIMLGAVMFGHEAFQPVIEFVDRVTKKAGKPVLSSETKTITSLVTKKHIEDSVQSSLVEAYALPKKGERQEAIHLLKSKVLEAVSAQCQEALHNKTVTENQLSTHAMTLFKELERDIVRSKILDTGTRIDGRSLTCIRPIDAQVGVLPRAHGSALFTRGETQALVVTTLGTSDDEQRIDGLEGEYKEAFMLHYNFPSFCVGEIGRPGSVGRREVGHGKLAWRALHPLLPSHDVFPHTLRVVAEILESNGSSSMATVCGASLSLMDACVPIARPVSGIAMGLIMEGEKYAVLSDILGDEDNLGDMDFKVAGTSVGITALQMDIKIPCILADIMRVALAQAVEGILHILAKMNETISQAHSDYKDHMPRVETLTIPKDKIRDVIGTGGKVIREITEKTEARIDISDNGLVKISYSPKPEIAAGQGALKANQAIKEAMDWIKKIVSKGSGSSSSNSNFKPEEGKVYDGEVVKIMRYGAFVNFLGTDKDGLVYVTQIPKSNDKSVEEVLREGQKVKVKVIGFDEAGKVCLSMRGIDQVTGQEIPDLFEKSFERGGRGERSDNRGGDRGDRGDRGHHRNDRGERSDNRGGDRGDRGDRGHRNNDRGFERGGGGSGRRGGYPRGR